MGEWLKPVDGRRSYVNKVGLDVMPFDKGRMALVLECHTAKTGRQCSAIWMLFDLRSPRARTGVKPCAQK